MRKILSFLLAVCLLAVSCTKDNTGSKKRNGEGVSTSKWEINSSLMDSNSYLWSVQNRMCANHGNNKSAYIHTEKGNSGNTEPMRSVANNSLSVSNLTTGDRICFTIPNTTVLPGSTVDFMITLQARNSRSPKYWIFEYKDGGEWKSDRKSLVTEGTEKYSFYLKYFKSENYTTFTQHFTLENGIEKGDIEMRIRVTGKITNGGDALAADENAFVNFVNLRYAGCYINVYQNIPVKDVTNILVLGNSRTYYYASNFILKEIARSQGHEINMQTNIKADQYLSDHLSLELTDFVIGRGGYDYAILQDGSPAHRAYFLNPQKNAAVLESTRKMADKVRAKSPEARLLLESTWAGRDDGTDYDEATWNGSVQLAQASDCLVSPVGKAFRMARDSGIEDLFYTDGYHPNRNGAYLKACVYYLLIFGEDFDDRVPNALVNSDVAEKLRKIARYVILGK